MECCILIRSHLPKFTVEIASALREEQICRLDWILEYSFPRDPEFIDRHVA
jgi:hypothetical protein